MGSPPERRERCGDDQTFRSDEDDEDDVAPTRRTVAPLPPTDERSILVTTTTTTTTTRRREVSSSAAHGGDFGPERGWNVECVDTLGQETWRRGTPAAESPQATVLPSFLMPTKMFRGATSGDNDFIGPLLL